MTALEEPLLPAERITPAEYAIQALAEAMAARSEPLLRTPPSKMMIDRATEVVRGVLDVAGQPFAVLVADCVPDAERLAIACGKDSRDEDVISDALLALKRLTALP